MAFLQYSFKYRLTSVGVQKFVDNAPKLEICARPTVIAAPSVRAQPAHDPPSASPVSNAAPVTAGAEPRVAEQSMPTTTEPPVEREGDAAATAGPESAGVEQSKSAEPPRDGGQAEQPKEESGALAANGRAEPQASTGVVRFCELWHIVCTFQPRVLLLALCACVHSWLDFLRLEDVHCL